jgi:hypothetical protein
VYIFSSYFESGFCISDKAVENSPELKKKPTVNSLITGNVPSYERIIIGGESDKPNPRNVSKRMPQEVMAKFQDKSREVRLAQTQYNASY